MFDIMIERIAITDALKSKPSDRRNELGQACLRRSKAAGQMRGKKGPQCLRGQFGYGNHDASNWIAKRIVAASWVNCNTGPVRLSRPSSAGYPLLGADIQAAKHRRPKLAHLSMAPFNRGGDLVPDVA